MCKRGASWFVAAILLPAACDGGSAAKVDHPDGAGGASSDGGTADRSAGLAIADQACAEMAAAACDALAACGSLAVASVFGDGTTCLARLIGGCVEDQGVAGTSRTAADIAACAQALATAPCHDLLLSRYPAACAVKPGARANGAACGSDWQCESTYCRKAGDCGTCDARAGEGGACLTDSGCVHGMVCLRGGHCAMPGDSACSGSLDPNPWAVCRSDLYCSRPMSGGACVAKYGANGGCETNVGTNNGVLSEACDLLQGVACSPASKTCVPATVARGGETCGAVAGVVAICAAGSRCVGPALVPQLGVCASPAADGAACGDTADGATCLPPARCEAGICRRPSVPSCG